MLNNNRCIKENSIIEKMWGKRSCLTLSWLNKLRNFSQKLQKLSKIREREKKGKTLTGI